VDDSSGSSEVDSESFRPFGGPPDEPVDLVWPTRLHRGSIQTSLVYLDLNHWIGLSDAVVGRSQGDNYRDALAASREARRSGRATFPLSATHYMEIAKIVDPSRRSNLAAIMEELSGFATLASRPVVTRLEIEAVLDQELGLAPSPPPVVDLVGWGVRHSVGTEGAW